MCFLATKRNFELLIHHFSDNVAVTYWKYRLLNFTLQVFKRVFQFPQ